MESGKVSAGTCMKTDYLKFVEWSDGDGVYIGYCPDLFIGGACHGKNRRKVYTELCRLVIVDLKQRETDPKRN